MSTSDTIARASSPALDEILGHRLPVLDDGFVRVVDYMGNDEAIVQAARVSYGQGTRRVHEDRGLIRYLMRHRHTTPFEMCEVKLHVRVPMDCWRQWIRHRTANVNEYSTRYSVAIDAAQRTPATAWRLQSASNKQGSAGFLDEETGRALSDAEEALQRAAREAYEARIARGVAREQARKDLPLSTYTEAYWKVDLHNLLHFLDLRMDEHAQEEIRAYALLIGHEIVKRWVPFAWESFMDYRRGAMPLTRIDVDVIRALSTSGAAEAREAARRAGLLGPEGAPTTKSRERRELEDKLRALGLHVPWPTDE